MRNVLRWLIFNKLAPGRPWFRRIVRRALTYYTAHGDTMIDLGGRPSADQVETFKQWWMRDER